MPGKPSRRTKGLIATVAFIALLAIVVLLFVGHVLLKQPEAETVQRGSSPSPWNLPTVLQRIPPLKHDVKGRWPLLLWIPLEMKSGDHDRGQPLPVEVYAELRKRGLALPIGLNEKFIPMALAMQQVGCPVIITEGLGGNGPGGDAPDTLHTFDPGFQVKKGQPVYPCTMIETGWRNRADKIRAALVKFKEAGVMVNAAWMDWEVEPFPVDFSQWRQASHCTRCRTMFPKDTLRTPFRHANFVWLYRNGLFSEYLAKPVLSVFPDCSVANYDVVFSSKEHPSWTVYGAVYPPIDIGCFTASMPDVYGSDAMFTIFWYGGIFDPFHLSSPLRFLRHRWYTTSGQEKTDRIYTQVMLAEISADAANRQKIAPGKHCVPYIARYVVDADPGPWIVDCTMGLAGNRTMKRGATFRPILSRARYREILRHVWLRGAMTMVVYNPFIPYHPDFCVEEVEDAVVVYDEMLAWKEFQDKGSIMNTTIPNCQEKGAIWSGLRLDTEAVVRAFTQGVKPVQFRIAPWLGLPEVDLMATPEGVTYRVKRKGVNEIVVETIKR